MSSVLFVQTNERPLQFMWSNALLKSPNQQSSLDVTRNTSREVGMASGWVVLVDVEIQLQPARTCMSMAVGGVGDVKFRTAAHWLPCADRTSKIVPFGGNISSIRKAMKSFKKWIFHNVNSGSNLRDISLTQHHPRLFRSGKSVPPNS